MKRKFTLIALSIVIGGGIGIFAASSTETPQSLGDGLHITGAASDRSSLSGATPVVQQATTVTAQQALMNWGLIASGTDYSLKHKTVTLSAAQIIAMYTTPVELVPAPGAGRSIIVQKLKLTMVRTSTAFTGGAAAIVQYDSTANGAGTQALDSTIAATEITGAAGTSVDVRNGAVITGLASTSIYNKGLFISNGTAVFAAGTGTGTVEVWYYDN